MPKGRGKATIKAVMHEFKHGTLHSGSKTGPIVTNPKQAIAIALSEAGLSKRTPARKREHRGKRDRSY